MSKISAWWLLAALAVGLALAYLYFQFIYTPDEAVTIRTRKNYDVITLSLPNSKDADIFGPKYWAALHAITDRIPCSICRDKAVPFMSFFHDVVNKETGKELFDKQNFNKHIDMICQLPKG